MRGAIPKAPARATPIGRSGAELHTSRRMCCRLLREVWRRTQVTNLRYRRSGCKPPLPVAGYKPALPDDKLHTCATGHQVANFRYRTQVTNLRYRRSGCNPALPENESTFARPPRRLSVDFRRGSWANNSTVVRGVRRSLKPLNELLSVRASTGASRSPQHERRVLCHLRMGEATRKSLNSPH